MNDFWDNISRYPRFFISSVTGLVIVILAPLSNLFKIKKFRWVIPLLFFLFTIFIISILKNMTGL